MKRVRHLVEFLLALSVLLPLALLPRRLARPAGALLGGLLARLFPKRRRVALRNTELVYGQARPDLVASSYAAMGMSLVELARIWLGRQDVFQNVRFTGLDHYCSQRAAGRPVVFITAHAGNWELLNNILARRDIHFSVVVRPLDNPYLDRVSRKIRERYGNRTVSKWGALRTLLSELRRGGVVAILSDQAVVPQEGVITDFFGHPAYTVRVPALLAQKTGAAIVPAFIRRTPKGHQVDIYPALPASRSGDATTDVEADSQRIAAAIETHVRRDPAGWLWIHRRWKRAVEGA